MACLSGGVTPLSWISPANAPVAASRIAISAPVPASQFAPAVRHRSSASSKVEGSGGTQYLVTSGRFRSAR